MERNYTKLGEKRMTKEQRVIKFRALGTKGWTPTENNGWYYGTTNLKEYMSDKSEQVYSLSRFERLLQGNYLNSKTRGQFIGLKDINKVEIYEGDILQSEDKNAYLIKHEFSCCSFVARHLNSLDHFSEITYCFINNKNKKVIGNIYENPELIKD